MANASAAALIVDEEECPVPLYRTAHDAAELAAAELRLVRHAGGEEISCAQRLVPEELEGAAVDGVAAGLVVS